MPVEGIRHKKSIGKRMTQNLRVLFYSLRLFFFRFSQRSLSAFAFPVSLVSSAD